MELSLVVPLYNEEESIGPLHERVDAACSKLDLAWEVIYVDDGSSDATWHNMQALRSEQGEIVLVRLGHNSGQTAAMAAGLETARGKTLVTMDGDMQNDPADIQTLLRKADEGYDIVCGWRKNRQDKLVSRKIPSKCANWLIRTITGVRIHDYGCSLKVYRGELVKRMRLYSDMHRFLPFVAQQAGARVGECVVNHNARQFGVSKYGIGRTWKVLLDLISLKLLVHYFRAPLIMFAALALPFMMLGTSIGIASLFVKSLQGPVLYGTTFLLIGVGVLIVFVGLLGQAVADRERLGLSLLTVAQPGERDRHA